MRNNYFIYSIIIAGLLVFSVGCDKIKSQSTDLEINLANHEVYHLELGYFGDEEGPSIIRDATHAMSSTILGMPWELRVYEYIPTPDYVGVDTVEVKTERGSDGASPNEDIEIFKLYFRITR